DLPAWKFDLFYRGIFTRPAGQIYDCFENRYDANHPHMGPIHGHKCKPFLVPADWPRIVSGDFGNVNTALGLWAENPATRPPGGKQFSGRCYLIKEYKAGNRTARQHLTAFLGWKYNDQGNRIPGIGENVKLAVGGAKSEDGWRKLYTDAGLLMVEPPVSDVEVGINNLYGMLKRGEVLFFDTCDKIIADIAAYSRELTPTGDPTEKIEAKETYHLADMARYFAAYVRFKPDANSRGSVSPADMLVSGNR
ncbi:MAG: hypothetical protein EBR82_73060, partial [Caulobacteraceae bacterium]|nr:hypothetical protein [Caulobacteraceae bacterium]